MSERPTNGSSLLDPFGIWKAARDANLEAWSKLMIDVVNSDEYARATGSALDQTLAMSQPFRQAVERIMTQTLATMNMPSRAEVISVAERLINVEVRLDDLDAKITTIRKSLEETTKETVHQAMATPNRHLNSIENRLEKVDSQLAGIQETVKQAMQQVMATTGSHIREIESNLSKVDAKISALQPQAPKPTTVARVEKPEAKVEAKPEMKPEIKPQAPAKVETKAQAKPEVKPPVKPEVKPEVKAEVKPPVKPEVKPEVKIEPKVEAKPVAQASKNGQEVQK